VRELKEEKETFQKSADYLRETLKTTEKSLEEVRKELEKVQENSQKDKENHQQTLNSKKEELKQRNEAFKVVQERNGDLTGKLSNSQQEITKLSE
jgi:prefoldin subunit 5